MKKVLVLVVAVACSLGCIAQSKHGVTSSGDLFVDFGIKGLGGSSVFINTNLFEDSDYNHGITGSYGFGGKFAFDFGEQVALVVEGLYGVVGQKFNIKDSINGDWSKSIKLKTIDIPIMIRKNNPETGGYVEIGPQISLLRSVSETTSGSIADYNKKYWSMVLGFGGYLWGTDNFGISSGLRFVYTFQDVVGSNEIAGFDGNSYMNNAIGYESYQKTTPLSVFFVLEANYDLGFMVAKNECTGRRKFMFYN
ncbi:MAG: hypothetical protein JKY42_11585 [Flavobacteriales bacterium]|nr:hypothetical protein [Flavobacteriales bacterium]